MSEVGLGADIPPVDLIDLRFHCNHEVTVVIRRFCNNYHTPGQQGLLHFRNLS
jgi:hypothetical protein